MEYLGPMLLTEVEVVQLQIINKFKDGPGNDKFV